MLEKSKLAKNSFTKKNTELLLYIVFIFLQDHRNFFLHSCKGHYFWMTLYRVISLSCRILLRFFSEMAKSKDIWIPVPYCIKISWVYDKYSYSEVKPTIAENARFPLLMPFISKSPFCIDMQNWNDKSWVTWKIFHICNDRNWWFHSQN